MRKRKLVTIIICFALLLSAAFFRTEGLTCVSAASQGQVSGSVSVEDEGNLNFENFVRVFTDNIQWVIVLFIIFLVTYTMAVIYSIRNVDEKKRGEQEQKEKDLKEKLQGAFLNYESAFIVDAERDRFRTLKQRGDIDEQYENAEMSYSEVFRSYTESVYEADRELLKDALRLDNIRRRLKKEKEYSVRYRGVFEGYPMWYEARILKTGEHEFVVAFVNIDEEVAKEQTRSAVLGEYFGVYLVDLPTDSIRVVKPAVGRLPDAINVPAGTFSTLVSKFAENMPERYRAEWSGLASIDGVRKFLADANKRDIIFESAKKKDTFVRCSYYVIERINGEVETVCIAFSDLDDMQAERERLNEQISHQKKLLDYFVESYSSAFSVDLKNNTYEILHLNHDFIKEFNSDTAGEDMMRFIDNHIYAKDRENMRKMIDRNYVTERLRTDNSFTFTVREMVGGEQRTMKGLIVRGIDEYHIAVGFIDITKELKHEKEQRDQMRKALNMAKSANRSKTIFLNNMSHDIRTPMNAIIGYTGLAASHIDNREQALDYLSKIGQSSDHLLSLINDILDMSRIESGKVRLEEKEEDLSDIMHKLCDLVQADVQAKQLDFCVKDIRLDHEIVLCDKLRLNQVLINIMSNAIKYTDAGGRIELSLVENEARPKGYGMYIFSVRDNGMGMSREFLDHIFEPFERVRTSTVSGIQGTGLGMTITKSLVDMMGGKLDIQSELGVGTEVTVTFAFKFQGDNKDRSGQQEIMEEQTEAAKEDLMDRFRGKKILLVEDNALNREIATELLKEFGIEVFTATDGDEAVGLISIAQPGDYDVVLMDIQMPRLNGFEATRQIRELKTEMSKVPILAMSANAFEEDKREAAKYGMDGHIAKPINVDELKETLRRYL